MSMIGNFLQLSSAQLESLIADPSNVDAVIYPQGNRIFRERHKYCGESSKGKRAVVTARRLACVTEDDL